MPRLRPSPSTAGLAGLALALGLLACSDDSASTKQLAGADASGIGTPIPGGGRDAAPEFPDAAPGGSGGSGGAGGSGGSAPLGGSGGDTGGSAGSGGSGGSTGGSGGSGGVLDPDANVAPPDPDARVAPDPDARVAPDPDARVAPPPPDAAPPPPPDPDAAVPPPPVGVTPVPCLNGPGSTLFRMHWFGGSHSADIDVWEASCDYSIAPNSACSALPICRGGIGCEVGVTDGGDALALDGGNQYLQVRFDVTGLFFRTATVYLEARGMNGNTDFEAWSPLYGGLQFGPVSGGFEYQAGSFDWTGFVNPGDDPGLTALRITPVNGSLALHSVELCLE